MFQQHFDASDHFASSAFRDRTSESSMCRFRGEFLRYALHRQKQHGKVRPDAGYFPRGLQAVHLWHRQVEYNHVRGELSGLSDGVLAVERVAADCPVCMVLDEAPQQAADGGVVIGNQNAYCHRLGELERPYYAASNCPNFNTVDTRLPEGLPAPRG